MPPGRDDLHKEFWERALDRAQLGLWDWDLRSGHCFYSSTWARMLGYEQHELRDSADLWLQLTHPDDREQAVTSGDQHLAGLTDIIETELRLRHKDGHWVWVLDRGGVIERDETGKPVRMVGVQTDISRQKEAEYQLGQVNIRFRLALAASGTGVWHYDIATRKSFWDARTRQIFGFESDSDEVSSDLWHSYLHPEDKERTEREHQPAPGSQEVTAVRYRIVRRDGEVRHLETLLRFVDSVSSEGQILGTVRDITEDRIREEELAYAARHDSLTGLLNRIAFDKLLSEHMASVDKRPIAVFYVDLDYFKALNDFAGHAAGDTALRRIAAGITRCLPPASFAARLGGDEFALLVPYRDNSEMEDLAVEILAAIRDADLGPSAGSRRLSASVGIFMVREGVATAADALACADDACYAAKASGRNRFSVFSSDSRTATAGLNAARIAADTMDALDEGRLELYGQEIHRLGEPWQRSGTVEVLSRVVGRDGILHMPSEFIPAAERFGVASKLDRWIIRTALTRYSRAMSSGDLTLAFNLSAQTISDPQLWPFVDSVIADVGAPPSNIVFEITETAAVTSFEAAELFVHCARERRCKVSLDDFGAGLSSFEYLRRFPVDTIKINGSFVEHMASSKFDREIVGAIAGIARSLGYKVVAEKIEKPETLRLLVKMGVQYGQGFLLHKPEPLEQLVASREASGSRHSLAGTG
jgi:diguanylate cyclase (GGDEF)-like protein/PAS domain S-box-containing protein